MSFNALFFAPSTRAEPWSGRDSGPDDLTRNPSISLSAPTLRPRHTDHAPDDDTATYPTSSHLPPGPPPP